MREYIAALWADWMALMSGIASVALAVWVVFFPPVDIYGARTLLWVSVIACFLFASYRIWAKERDATEKEIARLKAEHEQKESALQSRIAELTTHKLKFEIDSPRSKVSVSYAHGNEGYSLSLQLYIRFINNDTHTLIVQSVDASLIKVNEDNTESSIVKVDQGLTEMTYDEHSTAGWKLKGWDNIDLAVSGREQTLYHPIRGYIDVVREARQMFGNSCYLRVSMAAMNQPPYSLDFAVDWDGINQGWMSISPRT